MATTQAALKPLLRFGDMVVLMSLGSSREATEEGRWSLRAERVAGGD